MEKDMVASMTPDRYIEERVKQYQSWYNGKSVGCKSKYLKMRALSVVGGATVPVLVNLNFQYVNIFATIISLMVVIFVSLESVFHYREQWKNYRSTEQYLGHEQIRFLTKIGVYKELDDKDAFLLFVERVESAISNENSATLNIMTLASEGKTEEVAKQIR